MKGQAISPPHNYPVLKQESGIDWPGSVLGDWTCQSPALPGRASPCKLDTQRIYEMCVEGLGFLLQPWDLPVRPRHRLVSPGAALCGWALGRSPVGSSRDGCSGRRRGRLGDPTPSDPTPPRPRTHVAPPAVWSRGSGSDRSSHIHGASVAEPRTGLQRQRQHRAPPRPAQVSRGAAPRPPTAPCRPPGRAPRMRRSWGRSERRKVPSRLPRFKMFRVLEGDHQFHRKAGEGLADEGARSLRVMTPQSSRQRARHLSGAFAWNQ